MIKMENRKIRLTKRLIKEAIIELLKDKNIEQITVKELSEKADINRSTFYTHYCDVYAVIEEMAEEFMNHVPFPIGKVESTANEIAESFKYFCNNKDVSIALLKSGYYKKYLCKKAKKIFEDGSLMNGKMIDTDKKFYLAMSAYTCSGMESFLLYCLENNVNISPENYGKIFYDIDEYCKNAVIKLSAKE